MRLVQARLECWYGLKEWVPTHVCRWHSMRPDAIILVYFCRWVVKQRLVAGKVSLQRAPC